MYVLQCYEHGDGFKPGTWRVYCGGPVRYKALDEAQVKFDSLSPLMRMDMRIAEEYTVTRYKAVKLNK